MKIDARQIPDDGLTLIEEFSPDSLDLDTDIIKFLKPIKAVALVRKSYNALQVVLTLSSRINITCARCLKDNEQDFIKKSELNYAVDKLNPDIELDPDIREEIILDYPIKPLCKADCRGLCPKCGENLNEGGCNCGIT
ncbi:MAG: DUF177 domain-containing protein [Candidatus Omnitrophica bacterium]|nr:DUF177 domain-containing protein [Candidatus Omnitrophota bacterium]MDD3988036.1 DUF177 domain-containing protein [Candidatus Omnitrophota bacterium]MDD4982105.1 DUF177 domain-containing protein [Candidatus Omnitrophota bacterium]MDD5665623.1 DUF177 domain-containing protein [Candidatus Omnitrophota bacterium]